MRTKPFVFQNRTNDFDRISAGRKHGGTLDAQDRPVLADVANRTQPFFAHTENHTPDIRPVDRAGAHRAGLYAGIERRGRKPFRADIARQRADRRRFGMSGRVAPSDPVSVRFRENHAITIDHDGAEGALAGGERLLGVLERAAQERVFVRRDRLDRVGGLRHHGLAISRSTALMGSSLSSGASCCFATHCHVVFTRAGLNMPSPSRLLFSLKISGSVESTSARVIARSTSGTAAFTAAAALSGSDCMISSAFLTARTNLATAARRVARVLCDTNNEAE